MRRIVRLKRSRDEMDEVHELEDLAGIHARGGLVEEEEARVAGEGARDLDAPLLAVGEVLRNLVRDVLELEYGEEVQRLVRQLLLVLTSASCAGCCRRGNIPRAAW